MAVDPPVLAVKGLTKSFGDLDVIDGLDLTVRQGELMAIVGPSGCGKTTLLRLLAGLETPTAGSVKVRGEPVTGSGPDRVLIFQEGTVFPWATVEENVSFGMEARGDVDPERVAEAVRTCGLDGFQDNYPRTLSGGMERRVALARAMVAEPDMLLMDEPFSSLDAQTSRILQNTLMRLWKETGTTVVLVTHDVEVALRLASRVMVVSSRPLRERDVHDLTGKDGEREVVRRKVLKVLEAEVGERLY
ncbi:MAG: ABC transporter ATP-binding protein [Candidatus Undinarchaeales archaeon]|nr:ABC transporter ATP-binding protein [Candidatus Undinarchaeales archaeon]MDP7493567.1 ABC transporter ATP-binding protein [Candidatus Undinarchaeales archaeon]